MGGGGGGGGGGGVLKFLVYLYEADVAPLSLPGSVCTLGFEQESHDTPCAVWRRKCHWQCS